MDGNKRDIPESSRAIWKIKVSYLPSLYKYRGYFNGIWFKDYNDPLISMGLLESLINDISSEVNGVFPGN